MTRWNSLVLLGSLFASGCMLDTAGTASTPPTNQGQGGIGQGGAGQGGGGEGGAGLGGAGGQGGSPECAKASDCAAPAAPCAVAACENGVCVEAPGNAKATCRAAVSKCDVDEVCDGQNVQCPEDTFAPAGSPCRAAETSCDVAEVCDGASAACAPDTGPAAACTPKLPITYLGHERTFTITAVNLAGTGQTTATVNPGMQVTLQVGGNWQRKTSPSCPSCITQFYVGIEGTFQDCADTSGQSGTFNRNITFLAPQKPGVYFINPTSSWEYQCVDVTVPAPYGPSSVATLVVQ